MESPLAALIDIAINVPWVTVLIRRKDFVPSKSQTAYPNCRRADVIVRGEKVKGRG